MNVLVLIPIIIITSSVQGILIPKIVSVFGSMYFLLLIISGIFMTVLFLIKLIILRRFYKPKHIEYVVYIGLFNTFESVCMIYSANPSRTPILIQTILVGLVIIPSAILTKLYLKKNIEYIPYVIFTSLFLLICSLVISSIPLYSEWHWMSLLWIALYSFGVMSISVYNIMQEKSMITEDNYSLEHKISIISYGAMFKFLFVIPTLPLEWIFLDNPIECIYSDMKLFATDYVAMLLVLGFCTAYCVTCIAAVNLNAVSTNMNMISSAMVNVIVMSYYSLFPPENSIPYPLAIIIVCMILNICSILAWHYGERKQESSLP